ncbi:MAG: DUF805 domain-containing protein [Bacteroidales bacterium]|nr:DUF805 domain-containing protein [Bacteroidales bacterium]
METIESNTQPVYGERPIPSFWEATKTCLTKKYATFSGRARRSEYWWFMLAQYILSAILSIVMFISIIAIVMIKATSGSIDDISPIDFYLKNPGIWLLALVSLALIIPNLAVTVRRLHDIGRSGWWLLIPMVGAPILTAGSVILAIYNHSLWFFIPVVYLIFLAIMVIMIVWMATNGKRETNKWGPSPKYFIAEQTTQQQ